eukprot:TRINITY_DN6083_c0_g1_i1.p1 TRINITY_DN6083_c0_g1~~TRINITY_DN6083_c0_g1_i1.p1  ORF type:complete len:184 (+),score=29.87 TRINITY_DN6083_c0_g1_i1:238-789(+)
MDRREVRNITHRGILADPCFRNRPVQGISTHIELPLEKIQQCWRDGKKISELSYCDGLWILLTERVQGSVVGQGFSSSTEFPKEDLTKAWESGNAVDVLAWGDNQWVLITGKSTASQGYYLVSGDFPVDKIRSWYREEKKLKSVAYSKKEDLWVLVWEQKPQVTQAIYVDPSFPEARLKEMGF